MISTSFALSSIGWEDGVQPLRRHFSWRDASAVSGRWTLLGAWLEPESSQDVMFGSVGTHALRAEMQDALGSVAAAKPQDDSELLILVSDAKDAGDTPDILATAHAVSLASTNSTPTSAMRLPDAVRTACGFANRSNLPAALLAQAASSVQSICTAQESRLRWIRRCSQPVLASSPR